MLLLVLFNVAAAVAQRDFYIADMDKGPKYDPNTANINIRRVPKLFNINNEINNMNEERVKVESYYEAMCTGCRQFDSTQFKDTVVKLAPYLDVSVYPYGYAKTNEKDGHIEFTCQHGPEECYGNKLHACAIDYLNNITAAVCYNACMMDSSRSGQGSDDAAADVCGQSMNINSKPIKECAKGDKGSQLLKHYGEETKKVNPPFVPHAQINGVAVEIGGLEHFMELVCKAFKNPPSACNEVPK